MVPARLLPLLLLCCTAELASAQTPFQLGTRRTFAVGTTANALAVGDFNRDGNSDIAVALFAVDSVAVRLGDGKGNFGAPARYPAGVGPYALAAGDLNGDGIPELVIANLNAGKVTLMRGLAGGTFGSVPDYSVGALPQAVAIGDATGDGRPDAVVACGGSNYVTVLVGGGPGPGLTGASFNVTTGAGPAGSRSRT